MGCTSTCLILKNEIETPKTSLYIASLVTMLSFTSMNGFSDHDDKDYSPCRKLNKYRLPVYSSPL